MTDAFIERVLVALLGIILTSLAVGVITTTVLFVGAALGVCHP